MPTLQLGISRILFLFPPLSHLLRFSLFFQLSSAYSNTVSSIILCTCSAASPVGAIKGKRIPYNEWTKRTTGVSPSFFLLLPLLSSFSCFFFVCSSLGLVVVVVAVVVMVVKEPIGRYWPRQARRFSWFRSEKCSSFYFVARCAEGKSAVKYSRAQSRDYSTCTDVQVEMKSVHRK